MQSIFPELIRKSKGRTREDGSIIKAREGLDVTSLAVQSVGAINELRSEKDAEIEKLQAELDERGGAVARSPESRDMLVNQVSVHHRCAGGSASCRRQPEKPP